VGPAAAVIHVTLPKTGACGGSYTSSKMRVDFALLFGGRDVADSAAESLRADGYEVGFQDQHDGRSIVVTASPPAAQSVDEIAAARKRMDALARELGGAFLGEGGSEQYVLPR